MRILNLHSISGDPPPVKVWRAGKWQERAAHHQAVVLIYSGPPRGASLGGKRMVVAVATGEETGELSRPSSLSQEQNSPSPTQTRFPNPCTDAWMQTPVQDPQVLPPAQYPIPLKTASTRRQDPNPKTKTLDSQPKPVTNLQTSRHQDRS